MKTPGPSIGYKIMTVFMIIVCTLNVGAFVTAIAMFVAAYRLVQSGKLNERIEAQMGNIQSLVTTNMSTILTNTLVGGSSGFIVGTANSVIGRFGGDYNKFTEEDLIACHQTARREADLAKKNAALASP